VCSRKQSQAPVVCSLAVVVVVFVVAISWRMLVRTATLSLGHGFGAN